MNTLDYFRIYKETLEDSLGKIKKTHFKKMQVIKQLIETVEIFLSKQVYGRIVPGNYLLLFILLLGTKNAKLIEIGIRTIYKLFSFNFIHDNQQLSLALLREQFKEFLLIDISILRSRTFKQIYLQTLMGIQQKDQGIILLVAKNISLVVRMFQHSLHTQSILSVQQHLANELVALSGKGLAIEKPLKSTLVQILRHVLQNLRQLDYNVLLQGEGYTLQTVCSNSLTLMVDQIVMNEAVQQKYPQVNNYVMIPPQNFKQFKIHKVSTENENKQINGKFGWCIRCRKPADYYCKTTRVPVCSFECKNKYTQQSQQFDKVFSDQNRAQEIFIVHAKQIVLSLSRDLLHQDIKRRVITADIINLIFAQPRRFKHSKDYLKKQLSLLFKNSLLNVVAQNQAYSGCLVIIMKKLLYMDSFVNQIQLLIQIIIRKIQNIQMNNDYKFQLLKYLKQIMSNELISDIFINLDCQLKRKNSVQKLIKSIVNIYSGLKVPQVVYEEENKIKVLCIDIVNDLIKYLKQLNKKTQKINKFHLISLTKDQKAKFNEGIELFNSEAKPQKGLKLLFKEGLLKQDPNQVALFLMKNLDILKPTQVGECVGSHDQFLMKCLDSFIELISFHKMDIDEGMRHLLDHFTLPSESQQVSRIIESFGNKFYKDNKAEGIFASSSAVYSLSYLLMMLQSNLHNPQVVDKMKFIDYQKLAKTMNQGNDFSQVYLQHLYNSIQKNQLGFHEKQKQKDFAAAYVQGGKKLIEIYQKQTQKLSKRVQSQFATFKKVTDFKPRLNCIRDLTISLHSYIIEALTLKLRTIQQKQNVSKVLNQLQQLIILSIDNELVYPQQKILASLLQQINFDALGTKQSIIIENMMQWTLKYTNNLGSGWRSIFSIISSFNKRKSIVKVKEPRSKVLVVMGDRLCLQQIFIQSLFSKSNQYQTETIINMLNGLIHISHEELKDDVQIFSSQKILDLIEYNSASITDIFKLIWPPLRDYYVQLGLSPNYQIALQGVDFLKQMISKLMKKKQTLVFQKDFFVLCESIFVNCQLEGVKELLLSSISSLSTHHASQFKQAWKPILSIYTFSFESKNSDQIKIKTFQALNKLIESSLPYVQDFLFDLIYILGKLGKQKQQVYIKGCLRMIEEVIQYYNKKQIINPQNPNSADIEFLQKTLLPLLNIIASICGDHRSQLQGESMNVLFSLLMTYGSLFSYEFWKMIFQGVIRPTFDQILYTYQTRGNEPNKKQVTEWLKSSFTKLFNFISELVNKYYSNFRLFLADIFKIYENCIQNSNQLLTKLSINAVKALIQRVGHIFVEEDWDHFLEFLDTLFKKTTPYELSSVQSWRTAKQQQQGPSSQTYTTKCLSQLMLLDVADNVLERFSVNFSDQHLLKLKQMVTQSYQFTKNFNNQFQLRNNLWQEGFLSDMKQLPGLLKQQRQSLKCLVLLQFYRYQLAEQKRQQSEERFKEYISLILDTLNLYLSKQQLLLVENNNQIAKQQTQRVALNMRILVRDTIIPQLEQTDIKLIQPYKKQFFKILLQMLRYSTTMKRPCSACQRCEKCTQNYPIQMEFDEAINKLINALFDLE